jgi:hypothetical protein
MSDFRLFADADSSGSEYQDAVDYKVCRDPSAKEMKRVECKSRETVVAEARYVDQKIQEMKLVSVKEEVKAAYVGKLKRREEDINRLERVDRANRDIIRTLREDLKKEKEEGRKERDRCDRLRGENWNLLEKVKYWEKFDAQKNERKRKVREEQEEEARMERNTRMCIRIEEEERERIRGQKNQI